MAVDHVLLLDPAELDPVLDALPDPQHIDVGELERGADRAVVLPRCPRGLLAQEKRSHHRTPPANLVARLLAGIAPSTVVLPGSNVERHTIAPRLATLWDRRSHKRPGH
jgi:hypothetical protein